MRPEREAVIVGVGELADREDRQQPLDLMQQALRLANDDAGADLLPALDSLDLVRQVSWPYPDTLGLLCERLGHRPARAVELPIGGQTPLLALHWAALLIASGSSSVAAVVSGEAAHTVRRSKRQGRPLDWPRAARPSRAARAAERQRPVARLCGLDRPAHAYPLYETALTAAWGQSPAESRAESAALWAELSAVAAQREAAWSRDAVGAAAIAAPTPENRLVAWPYRKLMVANPLVNQGAAVLLASRAEARRAGIPDHRTIAILGGAAAAEPDDLLDRPRFDQVPAQAAVLAAAQRLAPDGFAAAELYSCFPCVPKLARRTLGLAPDVPLSVAGGLTFFGGPLNGYMLHAAVAMVQRLRAGGGKPGLLYGQGGYLTKHHALLLGADAAPRLARDFAIAGPAGRSIPLLQEHRGRASLESFTVLYDRNETPLHAIALCRTREGARILAVVPASDADTLRTLMAADRSPIGLAGRTFPGSSHPEWHLD